MRYTLLVAFLLSGIGARAQFFLGANVQGGIATSTNTSRWIDNGGNSGTERKRLTVAPMWSAQITVQYRYKWAWIESGFGAFSFTQSHIPVGPELLGDYKSIDLQYHYWNIPLKLGAAFVSKRGLSFHPYAGVNYLIEPTSLGRRWDGTAYSEEVQLRTKAGSKENGRYIMGQDDYAWSAPLECAGLRVEKKLSRRSVLQAGLEINAGSRIIQSTYLFATEDRAGVSGQSNYAASRGNCVGLTLGYTHRIF